MLSNGRIRRFDFKIEVLTDRAQDNIKNESVMLESVYVNRSQRDSGATNREITELKEIQLADNKAVKVSVSAVNAVGHSPKAMLAISTKAHRE